MSKQVSFGRWLKWRRGKMGLSQQELVERIDCSLPLLRKIESDQRRPSRQIALLLAAQLRVPPDEQTAFITFARSLPPAPDPAAESEEPPATPWRELHLGKTNLPAALTRLIGRERDSDAVRELLFERYVRLLTLTGPPGIGKTSLALAVAEGLIDEFEDGVYLVEFAAVETPDDVIPAIARSLGLGDGAEVGSALREKRMLLLLDNLEHLLDAAPDVIALLKASPWLKVLATSREALHVRSERQYVVPPLLLPDPAASAGLAQNPAVALFVERAAEVAPGFAVTAGNAADIAQICVMLDGLPLAIELAAGRVGWLTPEQIRAALQNRLQLLTDGPRDMPPRQRTLRGAIEWSYALLDADEQRLFARLGVFAGGCAPAAAREIAAADATTIEALLAKNLLSRSTHSAGGEVRLTMLQTIHDYAVEQLGAAGEEEEMRDRHARYYLTLAEENVQDLIGPDGVRLGAWFEAEYDNLMAALGWLLAGATVERVEMALRMCATLWQMWNRHGRYGEGREAFGAAVERVNALVGGTQPDPAAALRLSPTLPALWAKALSGLGIMAGEQGDTATARSWHEASLSLRRQLGDKVGMAASLSNLGSVTRTLGDYAAARIYQRESLALAREMDHKVSQVLALNALGIVEGDLGNDDLSRDYYLQSLALAREIGAMSHVGMVLNNLGIMLHFAGDYAGARRYFAESLAAHRELDDKRGVVYPLINLASVARDEGKYDEARALFWESLALLRELGDKRLLAECLEGLASVAGALRQGDRAARLYGAAARLREIADFPLSPSEQDRFDHYFAISREHLPAERWESSYGEGRAMTIDRMIIYARGHGR